MMEKMIRQIEEQQELLAEVYKELKEKDWELTECRDQIQELQQLKDELLTQLGVLPSTEEMLNLMDSQDGRIRELETENQQWKELEQKLNGENKLLQSQNMNGEPNISDLNNFISDLDMFFICSFYYWFYCI